MSHGESAAGLISNIFSAYHSVKDSVFKAYMTTQQDAYVDGKVDLTKEKLMELALNKYNILLESEKWNAPSDQDTQINSSAISGYQEGALVRSEERRVGKEC